MSADLDVSASGPDRGSARFQLVVHSADLPAVVLGSGTRHSGLLLCHLVAAVAVTPCRLCAGRRFWDHVDDRVRHRLRRPGAVGLPTDPQTHQATAP